MVGLLLLFNAEQMPALIVKLIGLLFLLPGVFGVIAYLYGQLSRNAIVRPSFPLMSIGSIMLGVYLIMYPDNFVTYLVFLIGFLLLLAGPPAGCCGKADEACAVAKPYDTTKIQLLK